MDARSDSSLRSSPGLPRAPFGRLVRIGLGVAADEPALWLLALAPRVASTLLGGALAALAAALFLHLLDDAMLSGVGGLAGPAAAVPEAGEALLRRFGPSLAGAWGAAALLAWVLDGVAVACAVRRARSKALGVAAPRGVVAEGVAHLGSVLAAKALLAPVEAGRGLWTAAAVGAAAVAWGGTATGAVPGAAAALALALAVTLALALALAADLIRSTALSRAVAAGRGPLAAIAEGAGVAWRRAGTAVGLLATFGGLALALQLGSGVVGAMFVGAEDARARAIEVAIGLTLQIVAALLLAAVDVARWSSFTALDRDEAGELPAPPAPPPPAEPVLATEPVVTAELVGPGAGA